MLRDWTDNPIIKDAPDRTTNYVVEVRCSEDHNCNDEDSALVTVNCPWSGTRMDAYWYTIYAYPGYCSGDIEEFCDDNVDCSGIGTCVIGPEATIYLSWEEKGSRRRGSTVRLDDTAKGQGYNMDQMWGPEDMKGFQDATVPAVGDWYWYMIRPDGEFCNEKGSWQNWSGSEPIRDDELP
jgi:hypothetical protein